MFKMSWHFHACSVDTQNCIGLNHCLLQSNIESLDGLSTRVCDTVTVQQFSREGRGAEASAHEGAGVAGNSRNLAVPNLRSSASAGLRPAASQGGLQQAQRAPNGAAEAGVLLRPGEPEWCESVVQFTDDAIRNGLLVILGPGIQGVLRCHAPNLD
jgi:hypothetical protein